MQHTFITLICEPPQSFLRSGHCLEAGKAACNPALQLCHPREIQQHSDLRLHSCSDNARFFVHSALVKHDMAFQQQQLVNQLKFGSHLLR